MGESYSLSPMQKGMLYHKLFEPHSGADLEQMVMRFDEPVNVAHFANAWERAAQRHEVLRTSFRSGAEEPEQVVHDHAPMELVVIDQAAYMPAQADARLADFLAADRTRGFDAERPPLSRLAVFTRGSGSTVVVWSFHHIILDGRSFPIVLADVFAAYDALVAGRPVELEPSIPYQRFIDYLTTLDQDPAEDYWRKTLASFRTPTPLVVEGIGAVGPATAGFGEIRASLDGATLGTLTEFVAGTGVTLNTALQAAWAFVLSTYSGEPDVVFGATRSGRYGTIDGADSMAGLFINTLPMRVAVTPDLPIESWLREIRAQHLALRDFEHTPLVDVQSWSEVPSGTRLFDSILVYESYQLDPLMRERTGTGDRVAFELFEQTNHPLLLSVYGGEGLDLRLEYDRSLFDPSVVERMVGHVINVLRELAAGHLELVADLDCVDEREASIVTEVWNDTAIPRVSADLVTRWRDRVALTPDAEAVVDGRRSSTFDDLDRQSDLLATRLVQLGVEPGSFVAVMLDRSTEALAALLGVAKSGAAYLPLDPGYPVDRLRYMVEDSGASVLVTDRRRVTGDRRHELIDGTTVLVVDDVQPVDDEPVSLPGVAPDAGAYIIYTSGSTGEPKGVVVSHDALVNHADGIIEAYGLGSDDRVLQFAALSFDVAAEEIFPTLLAGGAVVLRTDDTATSFDELHRVVDAYSITVVNLPAAYWSTWLDHLESGTVALPSWLRLVVVGSEKVGTRDHQRWSSLIGRTPRWVNAYGPTEATITASVFDPAGADSVAGAVMPIGKPLANVTLYVLDGRGRPVPIGVPGELHIGGRGIAIGYHGRPELTAERFLADPFVAEPGARLYRTGDLARWLPDGNVEFLGRVDDQVKIRGFRIELGEVEAAIAESSLVAQAAVVVRPDLSGTEQLIAHVVPVPGGGEFDAETLQRRLGDRLPNYMIPSAFAEIDRLPLTPSGKIDRSALPDVTVVAPAEERVPPRTDMERELASVWSDVLGIAEVGVHDNFFDAGGNSLSAIRLFSSVRALTGEQVRLPELFAAPTIAELATLLGDGEVDGTAGSSAPAAQLPSWVFPVKASGSRVPLFHLGGASVLRSLAAHLPADQPLYALLEQDLDADHFSTSVSEIVPRCIEGLKAVQPRGPYMIAGLCFGGVVALEMSRQLRANGDDVALTVMIDSFAPGALKAAAAGPVAVEPDESRDVYRRPWTEAYHPARLAEKARNILWRAGWRPLHELHRRLGQRMPDWLRDVEEANTIAADAYRATYYDGDVTLFRATEYTTELDGGPLNGWGPLIGGELFVADVTGGHISMYTEPKVVGLAQALMARIDAVDFGMGR